MTTIVEKMHDRDIQEAVEKALYWAPQIDAAAIGVAVRDGVVTLSGQLSSYWQKITAAKIALRTHGVTAVANDIVVHYVTDPPTDSDIATAARDALQWSAGVPKDTVKVDVDDHVVTLTGQLDWNFQREAAVRRVEDLDGVKDVRNHMTLKPRPHADARETEAMIRRALIRNASVDARHIHADVDGTRVILTGTVTSHAEKRQAEHAAWASPHVENVENDLKIEFRA